MKRHARLTPLRCCVLLLAPTAVLLLTLAPASDGIRLPTPAADRDVQQLAPVHGQGQQKKSTPASQGMRSGTGDGGGLLQEEEVRATGSSLPDCTHACGACSPCSRVMVSFKCSVAEPLPCPMVYRCMCRGKCYPVPSS